MNKIIEYTVSTALPFLFVTLTISSCSCDDDKQAASDASDDALVEPEQSDSSYPDSDGAVTTRDAGRDGEVMAPDGDAETEPDAGPCKLGTFGCECLVDEDCDDDFVCRARRCIPPLKCYTPCRQGFTNEDGEYRACSAEGLMEGCIDDLECVEGSCVEDEEDVPECENDVDCPDFQICLAGGCYSDCEYEDDCPTGYKCRRRVCRKSCDESDNSCPEDEFCSFDDGSSGVCLPVSPQDPDASPALVVDGNLELSMTTIHLSNTQPTAEIEISNTSPHSVEFEVTRSEHREYTADESTYVGPDDGPLSWLLIGPENNAPTLDDPVVLSVPANGSAKLIVENDSDGPLRWEGVITIQSDRFGDQRIALSYAAEPTGRWVGKITGFTQFGTDGLDTWYQTRDPSDLRDVKNAFVRKWAVFRDGDMSLSEFEAVITATKTESWRWPSVREVCESLGAQRPACYLYNSGTGVREYTEDTRAYPVPSGVFELPFAMNVKLDGTTLSGKIVSEQALQYGMNPEIALEFADDPEECDEHDDDLCVAFLSDLTASIVVGGRFAPTMPEDDEDLENDELPTCAVGAENDEDFVLVQMPWLVPGFTRGTRFDADTGKYLKYECRDANHPLSTANGSASEDQAENLAFARFNPIPDGASRIRTLRLIDGMLVNQQTLYILFEEHFDAFEGDGDSEGFSGYGLMVLERDNEQLKSEDYEPSQQSGEPDALFDLGSAEACPDALIDDALGPDSSETINLDDSEVASTFAMVLIDGALPSETPPPTYDSEDVHYLCWDTGLFDQGPDPIAAPESCPRESQVTFFASTALGDLSGLDCQRDGSCQEVLDNWQQSPSFAIHLNPLWRCNEEDEVYCDTDRTDLREDKTFFEDSLTQPAFLPLQTEVESAFRYKLRFQNRQGTNVGFAPSICAPNSSNLVPYCYSPSTIERLLSRVTCLVYLLQAGHLDDDSRAAVNSYLIHNFSTDEINDPLLSPTPITIDGFERLYAELLNMLGDDAYTSAFKSRFDLAGISLAAFPGAALEPNGTDLSGVAGYEMYVLYQAVQYYQMVLDRFFALSPSLWIAASAPPGTRFVTPDTVVTYFDRVLLASTHKSRALGEIGRRYQAIGRPDLARGVVERAYTAIYLEAIVLARMMRLIAQENPQRTDQVRQVIERAALTYRAALLDMREVYQGFSSDLNQFGFTEDYIPLPALQAGGPNAFETLLAQAQQSARIAAEKEEIAINSNRSFETDAQAFQAELARIRTTSEGQLAELCGSFKGDDGQMYPAIRRYASKSEFTSLLGDPCGLVGKGDIHNAIAQYQVAALDIESIQAAFDRLRGELVTEEKRINDQCRLAQYEARHVYDFHGEQRRIEKDIEGAKYAMEGLLLDYTHAVEIAKILKCTLDTSEDCSKVPIALGELLGAKATLMGLKIAIRYEIDRKKSELAELQQASDLFMGEVKCEALSIDGNARLTQIMLGVRELEIEAMKKDIALGAARAEISRLRDRATRLMAEQEENEQLAINIEAARNDPNTRIYKNDAILNADRTFFDALRDAYRATKVLEYYTSQSYEGISRLYLVRLVSRGDYNLEAYLAEIEDNYQEFTEEFRHPDLRVTILSLRDDILAIPFLDDDGTAIAQSERVRRFREVLNDPAWLNSRGYLTFPFSTTLARLSPITRNHKIVRIEAEIVGAGGDAVGRLYLSQLGTGTVRGLDDNETFYRFPPRTAVLNPFFNGVRSLDPEIYKNHVLRDRPYLNTSWELVFNQRDEEVNQDIDRNAIHDIRLYLYYEDLTMSTR